jgi:hypothetical protein
MFLVATRQDLDSKHKHPCQKLATLLLANITLAYDAPGAEVEAKQDLQK